MEFASILLLVGILILLAIVIIFLWVKPVTIIDWVKPVTIIDNEVGIVSKKFSNPFQPPPLGHQQIALQGEAGVQADTLPAGQYWRYWSWMYTIRKVPLIKVLLGEIGLVVAKDGKPIPIGRQLGKAVNCHDFQDARAFLTNDGQKGQQLGILTAGNYRINTELFEVTIVPLIKVPAGEIGLVIAKDGEPIPPARQLGRIVDCNDFQDAQAFLRNGGQKGQQMGILTAGNYRINTALFDVVTSSNIDRHNGNLTAEDLRVYTVDSDKIGIVTTFDGAPLPAGEIAASVIPGHDNFQNGLKFIDGIDGGGYKGLQEDIITAGAYNLNSWFVKVKQVPLIRIPAGTVGVVISHVGKSPEKQTSHELVELGNKGIWKTPLYPGRHAINTEVMSVVIVPTNPIALHWHNREKPTYNYDAKLRALNLRSKDGFLFEIEVTQIIRIKPEDAPQMILSIGTRETELTDQMEKYPSIRSLVTKVLEPTIGSYFRNSAQGYEAWDFHEQRIERQQEAKIYINSALSKHGVKGVDTLINEIDLSDELERIQQERKIVEKEHEKEKERQDFELDRTRHEVKVSRIKIEAETEEIRIKGKAEADVIRDKGEAEADVIRHIGEAETKVIEGRVSILSPSGYLDQKRIEQLANIKLPDTMFGQNGWVDVLMARMLGSGRDKQAPNEKSPEWLEKLMDFVNNNPTILLALKSFSDSDTPNNLAQVFTPPVPELPSGSGKDDATDAKVIITKVEQE